MGLYPAFEPQKGTKPGLASGLRGLFGSDRRVALLGFPT